MLQLELAVERSPGDPDFTGLSEVVGGTTTEGGAAMTSKFREWAASRQKDREQVFKQARLEREEEMALSLTALQCSLGNITMMDDT